MVGFKKEHMTIDYQYEKITLAALLCCVWPDNPFLAKLARKIPATLQELVDQADGS